MVFSLFLERTGTILERTAERTEKTYQQRQYTGKPTPTKILRGVLL